jgi:hypothetical protein
LDALASNKANILKNDLILHTNIVNTTTNRSYQHALCLRKTNGHWYILDSLNPGPIKLEQDHWQHLEGTVVIMAERQPSPTCPWGIITDTATPLNIGNPCKPALGSDQDVSNNKPPSKRTKQSTGRQLNITNFMHASQTTTDQEAAPAVPSAMCNHTCPHEQNPQRGNANVATNHTHTSTHHTLTTCHNQTTVQPTTTIITTLQQRPTRDTNHAPTSPILDGVDGEDGGVLFVIFNVEVFDVYSIFDISFYL